MKKPVYLRILLLLLLYGAVFTLIVIIQFPKQGLFTQYIGNLIVTGQHRLSDDSGPIPQNRSTLLTGRASVFFGGMEFCLGPGAEGNVLRFIGEDGRVEELLPESLFVSMDTATFRFPGGTELSFTANAGRNLELRISCNFFGGYYALELPFRPLRKTVVGSSGDGGLSISSDGLYYGFGPNSPDTARFVLLFLDGEPALSYRAMVERETLSFDDFILPEAQTRQGYNAVLDAWLDRNYFTWDRMAREQNNEDAVIALVSESIGRDDYGQAVSAVSPAFLNGNQRTYESSVYFGGLDQAVVSLRIAELAKFNRLSQSISNGSTDFLIEDKAYEFLALRGNDGLINNSIEILNGINVEELTLELVPGILEAYADWKTYRPYAENPFERYIEEMESVITGGLHLVQDGTRVFVSGNNQGDVSFNLRIGRALLDWADEAGEDSWAALAQSIILSALAQGEETLKNGFSIADEDFLVNDPDSPDISTAQLYRMLYPNVNYPKTLAIRTGSNPVWAWTAVPVVRLTEEDDALDIAVNFAAGETHYMIIEGIPAFERLQLYDMDFRTDPQFERYDSSGWAYSAANQTLMVKMRHRNTTEHIKIFFE